MTAPSDPWLTALAERSPKGPPCPACGGATALVMLRGAYCPECRTLRGCAEDRRGAFEMAPERPAAPLRAERRRKVSR